MPLGVERQDGRPPSALRQRLERVEDRLVLDARRDEVPASGHFEGFRGPANREVIGLGAAAGEDDFRRFGAHQGGHGAPRVVDCGLCLLSVVMNTRRIAEKMLKRAHHGLGGHRDRPGSSRCDQGKCACAQWNVSTRSLALTHSKIRARHVLGRSPILPVPTHDPGLHARGLLSYPETVGEVMKCGSVTKQCDNRRNRRCLPTKRLRRLPQQRRRPSVQRP